MSEEILKALAQLYAIITKQDAGATKKEREFVRSSFKKKLNLETVTKYVALYDEYVGYNEVQSGDVLTKEKLTSVKDSVKTLGLCRKINKTLTQKQKVVVLVELLELVRSDGNYTPQRVQIIDTVATAFNISREEYNCIENFVLKNEENNFNQECFLIINNSPGHNTESVCRHLLCEQIEGNLIFLHISSVDMIFLRYVGSDNITLNGLSLEHNSVALFSSGSTLRLPKGDCFYYSDILNTFISALRDYKLSFTVKNLEYRFANNAIGLRNINLSEDSGKLIGIMGASGAGKTTLLNVMAGLEMPYSGVIKLNGIDIHNEKEKIMGMIGFIAQDDLLIEELTVFENLYYNAKLCFKDKENNEILLLVDKVLSDLNLIHIKSLQVGNSLNKMISGGQRKRLNIALELIREPAVLFVDEPTSGLSSRDSENVIDLLKELSKKGTLIFVVIHQPSSDIYKVFDKMIILDTGGYLLYNGNPVQAVSYFKRMAKQADSDSGQCGSCGNVNPEQIFNIIEERVVDEYGNLTSNRKVTPSQWSDLYGENFNLEFSEEMPDGPLKILKVPGRFKQLLIFIRREIKSKISNRQYMAINFLEAPVLAFILAFIIRYKNDPLGAEYMYRYNENIPAYILMSIVVALFMGLSVSAEEIIKDRKLLKRESFLNLSRSGYLSSKLFILFSFSAIQALLFVLVGNSLLGIKGMFLSYWIILFTTSCLANVLGLIISSAFKTAVTVYICIPLLLIPQMILSGAMFSFDKINDSLKHEEKVPIVADLMVSRWAYEALAVSQYKDNEYQKNIYKLEQLESIANFNLVYALSEFRDKVKFLDENISSKDEAIVNKKNLNLEILTNELKERAIFNKHISQSLLSTLESKDYSKQTVYQINLILDELEEIYRHAFNNANQEKEQYISLLQNKGQGRFLEFKNNYFNESLSDLVRNVNSKHKYVEVSGHIVAKTDPVYFNSHAVSWAMDYRTHFFAPNKHLMGFYIDTFYFNVAFIWLQTLFLFVILYFDLFKRLLDRLEKISLKNILKLNF